jgi:hypothetical protein
VSKGGYNKLLTKLQESNAENLRLQREVLARDRSITVLKSESASDSQSKEQPTRKENKLWMFCNSTPVWAALSAMLTLYVSSAVSVKLTYGLVWTVVSVEFVRLEIVKSRVLRYVLNALFSLAVAASIVIGWPSLPKPKQEPDLDRKFAEWKEALTKSIYPSLGENNSAQKTSPPPSPSPSNGYHSIRHTLSSKEIEKFREPLISIKEGERPQIHLACPAADETVCVYAAQYIQVFRDAGWTVPTGVVERVTLAIPFDGIRLFEHIDAHSDPTDPKSQYQWMAITRPSIAVYDSFSSIGIISDVGHGDAIPKDSITIYFGPPKQNESAPTQFTKTVEQVKYQWKHNPLFHKQQMQ